MRWVCCILRPRRRCSKVGSRRKAPRRRSGCLRPRPGTKAQTEVYARIPGLKVWTPRLPSAVAIEGGATLPLESPDLATIARRPAVLPPVPPPPPLESPDLATIARADGGRLQEGSCPENAKRWRPAQVNCLLLVGRALCGRRLGGLGIPPEFECNHASLSRNRGGTWEVPVGGETARGRSPPLSSI